MVKKHKLNNSIFKDRARVSIGKLILKNPVMPASGTFGYGEEMLAFINPDKLGAVVTKTITLNARKGNENPRVAETPSGMLNAIGLENKGLKDFIFHKTKMLEKVDAPVIVSIAGESIDDFMSMAKGLSGLPFVKALELNLSCPNIEHSLQDGSCRLIAQDAKAVYEVVSNVKKETDLTLITKLTPNVTNIKEIAISAEEAGSDCIAAINTVFGISVDIKTRKPKIKNVTGGLSGPAIKPIALHCVREIYSAVKIPIIGAGGIMTAEDAIEFIICGAAAVQVGTANFVHPQAMLSIIEGINAYLEKGKIDKISSLVGSLSI